MNCYKLELSVLKIIFILILTLFSSCLYEPFGIYENPVNNNPSVPQITDIELNINADTLWIYGDYTLKYHFKSSNEEQNILGVKIYIDGVMRDSVMSENGEFSFLQSALSEGEHIMKIVLYVKSGTGSLADKLNAEAILLSKEWIVMADYSNRVVSYTVENGYLKLYWDEYKNSDLKSYSIQYSGTTKNNYLIDSSYYGAKRTFNVILEKTNGDKIPWGTLDIDENIPKPVFKISDDDSYYISWRKSPYYNAVKYRYALNNTEDNSSTYGFKKGNDTVYVGNLYFSDYFNFTLVTLPKRITEQTNDYMIYPSRYLSAYAGESINIRSYTTFSSADTLTAFDSKNIYKYFINGETVHTNLIDQGNSFGLGHMQISTRGRFLLGKYYNTSGKGMKYFAKDLTTGKISQADFVDPNYNLFDSPNIMYIADNGMGIFKISTRVFIYDFRNNNEIASKTFASENEGGISFMIAPDGKHYITLINNELMSADVYKINTSSLEKMYSLESGINTYQFSPTNPNIITTLKNKTLSIIQCEPYALIRKIDFGWDEVFMNIDYFNDQILTINANQFIIRDLNSGNIIKRIAKRYEQYYLYENFKLHNHQIIKNNVMLKIH